MVLDNASVVTWGVADLGGASKCAVANVLFNGSLVFAAMFGDESVVTWQ